MDRIKIHPMALDMTPVPVPREIAPWPDDVSRPWAETMPAGMPFDALPRQAGSPAQSVARWIVVAGVFGLVAYLMRGAFST